MFVSVAAFGYYYYQDRYVRQGDISPLERNVGSLEESVRANPQDPQARIALAEHYLAKKQYAEALEQANQLLSLYPNMENALMVAGIAYTRMNQPAEAIEPLEKLVNMRKDREMAHLDQALEKAYYLLGDSYLKLNNVEQAIIALEAAIAITRTDADALYRLGQAYQTNGRSEDALVMYHRAVRLVPDFTEAYSGMIESYNSLGQVDHVAYARGMEAFTQQDYKTAQSQLEQATQALPDFAPAFVGLALAYEQLDRLEDALVAIERGLELEPDNFAARQALGRIQATLVAQEPQQ